jgi:hypothetical protein
VILDRVVYLQAEQLSAPSDGTAACLNRIRRYSLCSGIHNNLLNERFCSAYQASEINSC